MVAPRKIDTTGLRSWARGPGQLELLDALEKGGSIHGASVILGVDHASVSRRTDRLEAYAAAHGWSPAHDMTKSVPDGFSVKGVSTLYDADGKLKAQWVKSTADDERREQIMREVLAGMCADISPAAPIRPPQNTADQLATLYTLTDCHVGMKSWAKETGADWDLQIAESVLVGCFAQMVSASPHSAVGFVNQLGDFLHYDSLVPVTPTSGHVVDADSRYSKMGDTAVRIIRRIVAMALEKHSKVVLLLAEGNHDISGSVWLRIMFRALYENEPRVEVIDSERPYYAYQHGKTMLAFHHGHLKKKEQLPLLFASMFPTIWGSTIRRYCHSGHMHHADEKEHAGMTVIQHPTIASPDSHAARHGYVSDRLVTAITYHKDFGQVARHTVVPEMLS
jgi:hypothetical protein